MDPAMTSLLVVVLPILISTIGAVLTHRYSATKTSVKDLEEKEKLLASQVLLGIRKILRLEQKIARLEFALYQYGWTPPDEDGEEENDANIENSAR